MQTGELERSMKYKSVIVGVLSIIASSVNASIESQTESVYAAYTDNAYKKALGLTRLYYGSDAKLTDFEQTVSGAFRMLVQDGGTSKEVYLLSDLQNVIEGKLLSPLIKDKESAHGIKALETYSKRNQIVDNAGAAVRASVKTNKTITVQPVSLTDTTDFIDHSSTASQKKLTTTDDSGISLEFYNQITQLSNITKGTSDKELYVFIDFNCPACRLAEPRIENFIDKGEITIHYIPVGFLPDHYERKGSQMTDSEAKAMYSLIPKQNSDRVLLAKHLLTSRPVAQIITQEAPQDSRNVAYRAMKENTLAFYKLPIPATPMAVYLVNGIPRFTPLSEKNTSTKVFTQLINRVDSNKSQ
jgi:protein-disulfide isomerase